MKFRAEQVIKPLENENFLNMTGQKKLARALRLARADADNQDNMDPVVLAEALRIEREENDNPKDIEIKQLKKRIAFLEKERSNLQGVLKERDELIVRFKSHILNNATDGSEV